MQGDMVLKVIFFRSLWSVYLFLFQSFLHIFMGPSAAHMSASGRSTRKGNAALHSIRTVSIYSIAYAATIVSLILLYQFLLRTEMFLFKSFVSSSRTKAFSARVGQLRAVGLTRNSTMRLLPQ